MSLLERNEKPRYRRPLRAVPSFETKGGSDDFANFPVRMVLHTPSPSSGLGGLR